jgi:uncharacterized protein (TIGR02594 family)
VIYDLQFNGYRLDKRNATRFNAVHAIYAQPVPEGFYQVGAAQGTASLNPYVPVSANQTNVLTREYGLTPYPARNVTALRQHYLFDNSVKALPGIQVESTFFQGSSSLTGLLLAVRYTPAWMQTAIAELGQNEVAGIKANPRILEYFSASKFWGKDDTGSKNAWCASFVTWVMQRHGYSAPVDAFRAKEWANFGRKIDSPVYGAIGIKSRADGGHTAFVVGKSADGNYLFMLGGNQVDEVNVSRYDKTVWETFVVPDKYDSAQDSLPIYTKPAKIAASES